MNAPRKEAGFILMYVVVAMTLVAAIVFALSQQGVNQTNIASGEVQRDQLRYIAEAGMAHAKSQLSPSSTCDNYVDIPPTPFAAGNYSATITPTSGSPVSISATGSFANGAQRSLSRSEFNVLDANTTQSISLQPGPEGDDAEIWDQQPTNNYGDSGATWVSSASNDTTRSLLRFNVDAIPEGVKVLEATLSLLRHSGSGADQPVSAHRIRNQWSEDAVTWNRRETGTNWDTAGGDFDNMAVATTPVGPANQRYEWNIAPLVQGWVDGSFSNYGVVLVAAINGMSGERFYTSDDSDPTRRPSLTIKYACECGQTCVGGGGGAGHYLDEFNAVAYNGNDGDLDWSNDWQESGETNGAGTGVIRVVSHGNCTTSDCLRIGLVDEEDQPTFSLTREADLTDASAATFSYDYKTQNNEDEGTVSVEVSADGGSNWHVLTTHPYSGGEGTATFDILPHAAPNTQIRFSIGTNIGMYLFVDNVKIDLNAGGGGGGGGGGTCDGTFRDEFNARSFSGTDGTLSWATNWIEVGESNGATSGDIQVRNDQSNYQLRTRDNNNGGEGVEREADLSGAAVATLNYDYRRMNLDSSSDYTSVEVSANGASGPWTELVRHQGSSNDSSYQAASHDITGYISDTTRIRFKTSSSMGNTDTVWFDNVEIACTP